jgi:hypothetical protein
MMKASRATPLRSDAGVIGVAVTGAKVRIDTGVLSLLR